jgi:hypothetical protein
LKLRNRTSWHRVYIGFISSIIIPIALTIIAQWIPLNCAAQCSVPGPILGDSSICTGQTTAFSDDTLGGAWYISNPAVATISVTGSFTALSTDTVTILYSTGVGCLVSKTIRIFPIPGITVTPSSPVTCSNSADTFTCSGSAIGFLWSPATGLSSTTGSSVAASLTVTATTAFTYTVIGIDTNGCTNIATITYSVNPLPTVTAAAGSSAVCSSLPNTLIASGGAAGYAWVPSTGLSATTGSSVAATRTTSTASSFTYSVIATDANGCANTAAITFSVNPLPTLTVTATTSVCSGISNTLTASGGISYAWAPSTGLSATTGSSVAVTRTVSTTSPFTYSVIGTDANGCSNGATLTYTVNPLPTITASAVTPAVCSGLPNTLTASGSAAVYTWSPSIGLSATTGSVVTATRTVSTASSFTYSVIGTDGNGCTNNAAVTYTVNPLPTVTATVTASSICSGVSNTLTVSGGASTYIWSPSTGLSATTGSTVTATRTVLSASSFTYSVIGTGGNGCMNNAAITYTVNPLPIVTAAPAVPAVCSGLSNTLIALGSSTAYVWSPSTGLSATTGSSVTVIRTTSIPSLVAYSVAGADANGCTTTTVVTYSVNPQPTVTVSAVTPAICSGFSNTLTASGSATTYAWSPSAGLSSTTGYSVSATQTVSIVSYFIYAVTGIDAHGCTNTATVTYTVNPVPALTATVATTAICSGFPNTLTASGTSTNYLWSPSAGLSGTTGSVVTATRTVSGGSAFFVYLVMGTDANGCSNTAAITYTVNPLPTLSATATPAICSGYPDVLTASGSATTYTWNPPTGLSATTGASVTGIQTVTAASSFTHTVIGTDIRGCSNAAVVTYTVNPLPVVVATALPAICSGFSNTLTAPAGLSYAWSPPSGLSSTTGSSVAATQTVSSTSFFAYSVIGTDVHGCINTATVTYTVNPLPSVSATVMATTLCSGFSNTLTASGSATSYTWNPPVGLSATTGNFVAATRTVSVVSPFTYSVAGTDTNGCISRAFVTYTVNPLPGLTVSAVNTAVCSGFPDTLNAAGSAITYAWSPSFGLSATTGSSVTAIQSVPAPSSFTYTVIGTDARGCSNAAMVTYTVNPLPVVTTTVTPTICSGLSNTLAATVGLSYAWSPSTGLSSTTGSSIAATQTVSSTSFFTYSVAGTDTHGCTNTATVTYTVNPLPTVFVAAAAATICSSFPDTLVASGTATRYAWSPSTALSATTGSLVLATRTTSIVSPFTYSVAGTDTNGCISSATITYTVNPLPSVTATAAISAVCSNVTNTLSAIGTATTYSWSPSMGLSVTTGTSVTATQSVLAVSPFTYTVTGTDARGCSSTIAVTYTVNPLPVITATATPAVCSGFPDTLKATAGLSYVWSPPGGLSAITGSAVAATQVVSSTSFFTYSVAGTDIHGCTNFATTTFTVNPLPTVSAVTAAPAVCSGLPNALFAFGSAITYAWSPPTGLSVTTGNLVTATRTAPTTSPFAYLVTGTDINGCVYTAIAAYTVNSLPRITVTATRAVCSGFPDTLTATAGVSYIWSPSTGLSDTVGNSITATQTVSTVSSFTYTVIGTDANGCVNTASVTCTVNPLPVIAVVSLAPAVCSGSADTLRATGGVRYIWGPLTGLSTTTGGTVAATQTVSATSSFTYSVIGTDVRGCADTEAITYVINPLPAITAQAAHAVCSGLPDTLLASGSSTTYIWKPRTGLSDTIGSFVTATRTVSTASTFTYSVTGTDINGCVRTATATDTVNPLPYITATVTPTVCSSLPDTLVAIAGVSYMWSPSIGLSDTVGSSVIATRIVSTASSFTYTVIGIDTNGCLNSAIVTYTVNPLPAITISVSAASVCSESANTLRAAAGVSYAWSPSTGLSATTGSAVIATQAVSSASSFTYSVIGTDTNGCANTATKTYTINPLPTIGVTATPAVCSGLADTLRASGSASTYKWTPPTGLSDTTGSSITATRTVSTTSTFTYSVRGMDVNGCVSTDTVIFVVNSLPIVTPTMQMRCSSHSFAINLAAITNKSCVYQWGSLPNSSIRGAASGTASQITDTLTALEDSVTIIQTYTVVATSDTFGCKSNVTEIKVQVSPIPKLIVTRDTICSGVPLQYYPQSSIKDSGGCGFTIIRPPSLFPDGTTITYQGNADSLFDKISTDINNTSVDSVIYGYHLNSRLSQCASDTQLTIVIKPTPVTPVIDSWDNLICFTTPCKGTKHINFSATLAPPKGIRYIWSSPGDDIDSSSTGQYCRISFNYIGTHSITLSANVDGFNCLSSSKPVIREVTNSVDTAGAPVYFNPDNISFIYPNNTVSVREDTTQSTRYRSYLWGWDDSVLKPNPLYTEINQVWSVDTNMTPLRIKYNSYWVISIDSATGCPQKIFLGQGRWDSSGNSKPIDVSMKCYPNPTINDVVCNIGMNNLDRLKIELTDISGQTLLTKSVATTVINLSFAEYPKGEYIISLFNENSVLKHCKIIKE